MLPARITPGASPGTQESADPSTAPAKRTNRALVGSSLRAASCRQPRWALLAPTRAGALESRAFLQGEERETPFLPPRKVLGRGFPSHTASSSSRSISPSHSHLLCSPRLFWGGGVHLSHYTKEEMSRAGPQQQASPGRNLAVSSSGAHPAPRTTHSFGSPPPPPPLSTCWAARPPPPARLRPTHRASPGHPRAVGLGITHAQVTLLGSRGRAAATTKINPESRGWERSHQPTPTPGAALPLTATSSSPAMSHGEAAGGFPALPWAGGCCGAQTSLSPPVPRQQPLGPSGHTSITSLLLTSPGWGLGWRPDPLPLPSSTTPPP